MRIRLNGEIKEIRALWIEDKERGIVKFLDQRFLPWRIEFYTSRTYRDTIYAIKEMIVRGAPSIGLAGAYGLYQALIELKDLNKIIKAAEEIKNARPTAVNLSVRVDEVLNFIKSRFEEGVSFPKIVEETYEKVESIAKEEVEANRKIGEFGASLIKDGYKILTHCNAGAPAAVDWGTALAPIRVAHRQGKRITVYVPETRPWLQGARITAWELLMEDIPYFLISDNAIGYFCWKKEIDIVIVGADRIALNGDFANKIGTYKIALCAKENGIPFYVAAPISTFDTNIRSGDDIVIEERSSDEVLYVRGLAEDGKIRRVLVAPKESKVRNPVFDVTPFKYVSGIITEYGILRSQKDIIDALKKAGRLKRLSE